MFLGTVLSAAEPNDHFTNSTVLTGPSIEMRGTLTNATRETGEPVHAVYGAAGSLWWSWTAPSGGGVELKILPGIPVYQLAQVVAVYRGAGLDALEEVASSSGIWRSALQFQVTAGETYHIAATDLAGLAREVMLSLERVDLAANDHFADRLPLIAGEEIRAINFAATAEPGEPLQPYALNKSLWWTWTAPSAGLVMLRPQEWTHLRLYTGDSVSNLTELILGSRNYLYGYWVEPGTSVHLRADEGQAPGDPPSGHIGFRLEFLSVPANDHFAERAVISGLPAEFSTDMSLATIEPNEPAGAAQSVWLEWTAPETTRVSLWVDAAWATPRARMFTGSSLDKLKAIRGAAFPHRPLVLKVRGGQKYMISVATDYQSGPFTLRILPPPPNDHFRAATELSGVNAESESYTTGASVEAGEPRLDRFATRDSVWWQWRAPASGLALLRIEGSDPVSAGVFTGNTPGSLRKVPSFIRHNFYESSFHAASGTVYRIGASGIRLFDGASIESYNGPVQLQLAVSTIALTFPSPPVFALGADLHAQAQVLAVTELPQTLDLHLVNRVGDQLRQVIANAPDYAFTFDNLPAGTLSLFATATNSHGQSLFSSPMRIRVQPRNDDFAQRILIPELPVVLQGSFDGAGVEAGEPGGAPSGEGSLWWSWTAHTNGTVRAQSSTPIKVFEGETLARLRPVATLIGNRSFKVLAGRTYHFRAAGSDDDSVYVSLAWLPANDHFANRILLIGTNLTIDANNAGATLERNEPGVGNWVGGASLWWTWTAPASGTLLITRTNHVKTTFLGIFRGTKFANFESLYGDQTESSPPVQLPVEAGVNYHLALHDPSGGYGPAPVTMHLRFVPQSLNDHFAQALSLAGAEVIFGGANYNATREPGEPARSIGQAAVEATLWWKWTATSSGLATISAAPGSFKPFVEVFQGHNLASLETLFGNTIYLGVPATFSFEVSTGQEYYLSVGGAGSARGEFELRLQAPEIANTPRPGL